MLRDHAIVPYIPVANVSRARKLYEEKNGLTPKGTYAGGVIYECGFKDSEGNILAVSQRL